MDYSLIISLAADIVKICMPISIIFGLTAKLYRMAVDFMFNRKVEI